MSVTSRRTLGLLVLVGFAFGMMGTGFAKKEEKPKPIIAWYLDLQKTAARYRTGRTQVETDKLRAEYLEMMDEKFATANLEFKARVTQVKWSEGIAAISTTTEYPSQKKAPVSFSRNVPFEFRMSQEEALTIEKGMWLRFSGSIRFLSRKEGGFSPSEKAQHLWNVKSQINYRKLWGRTYVVDQGEFTINNVPAVSRWDESTQEE